MHILWSQPDTFNDNLDDQGWMWNAETSNNNSSTVAVTFPDYFLRNVNIIYAFLRPLLRKNLNCSMGCITQALLLGANKNRREME